ncbi:MAG: hypothetical protein ABWK53_03070 [Anaerolineales bacterium]
MKHKRIYILLVMTLIITLACTCPISGGSGFYEPTRIQNLRTGDVQITLIWNNTNDLDLWVTDPYGTRIYYGNRHSSSGGSLDVDANPACNNLNPQPVENIYWPSGGAPLGHYTVEVHYYSTCESTVETPFVVRVLVDGRVREFRQTASQENQTIQVYEFDR